MSEWQTCFGCGGAQSQGLKPQMIVFNTENNSGGNYHFADYQEIKDLPDGLAEEFFCSACLKELNDENEEGGILDADRHE